MQLDETDVNILRVLQENGRLSFRQIAERVGVSVPTISSKVAGLEASGVIKGYLASLDPEKMGETSIIVSIKVKPMDLRGAADRFRYDENVRQIFLTTNSRILLVCSYTASHMINDFIGKLGELPEVLEYDITNVIDVIRESPRALVASNMNIVVQCSLCGKAIRERGIRTKLDGKDLYFCGSSCQKVFQEKQERWRSKA